MIVIKDAHVSVFVIFWKIKKNWLSEWCLLIIRAKRLTRFTRSTRFQRFTRSTRFTRFNETTHLKSAMWIFDVADAYSVTAATSRRPDFNKLLDGATTTVFGVVTANTKQYFKRWRQNPYRWFDISRPIIINSHSQLIIINKWKA